ncbi:hypothetical protein BO79DRAFT_213479 [Aspergillus costaricaensis CBS 115574]|uniref:Uncharacterized protein n=1 Tax=Aspergillus costaricaensis CBS 115574 TaxID=1448317 RepID=A0ACD1IT60_9EURO|nr:hypothetical protein BO79DRAFT_213479 [Aspergillus costaricaensis CBS 115574]RAK93889.1 hypothetical protein BO79DRAFT_213479 [Aspergillus costaricaensis CBS 115574]
MIGPMLFPFPTTPSPLPFPSFSDPDGDWWSVSCPADYGLLNRVQCTRYSIVTWLRRSTSGRLSRLNNKSSLKSKEYQNQNHGSNNKHNNNTTIIIITIEPCVHNNKDNPYLFTLPTLQLLKMEQTQPSKFTQSGSVLITLQRNEWQGKTRLSGYLGMEMGMSRIIVTPEFMHELLDYRDRHYDDTAIP